MKRGKRIAIVIISIVVVLTLAIVVDEVAYFRWRGQAWLLRRGVMDIHAVAPEHISGYQAHLLTILHRTKAGPQKLSPGYLHDLVASVCRFFKWLISARRIVINPAAQIELGHAEPHQPTNVMTEAETVLLIDSTDGDSPILIRDRAILELLYSTGLRRAEIAALDLTDIDLADRTVFVRSGKGSKQRLVPMGDPAAEALVHYLTKGRPVLLRRPGVVAFFLIANQCRRGQRLGMKSMGDVLDKGGKVVTAYTAKEFDKKILDVLERAATFMQGR